MTADRRAALVERMARAMEKADSHAYEYQKTSSWEHLAEAALDLALEEAALVADETASYDDILQRSAGCRTTGQRIAAAIRALKEERT